MIFQFVFLVAADYRRKAQAQIQEQGAQTEAQKHEFEAVVVGFKVQTRARLHRFHATRRGNVVAWRLVALDDRGSMPDGMDGLQGVHPQCCPGSHRPCARGAMVALSFDKTQSDNDRLRPRDERTEDHKARR